MSTFKGSSGERLVGSDFHLLGVNHKTLRVEDREAVGQTVLSEELVYRTFTQEFGECGLVTLSTCNRVELMVTAAAPQERVREVFQSLLPSVVSHDAVYHYSGDAAARHLFRVAASLDSLVLGEAQILGQVKDAYARACTRNTVDKHLHFLMQCAFRVSKRVRDETGIAAQGVSISYVAVQLAQQIVGDLGTVKVVVLGSGRMAELCTLHLYSRGCRHIVVANRTIERAADLARRVHGTAVSLVDVATVIEDADVIIGALSIDRPILTERMLASRKRAQSLFLIDLGVPRNFQTGLGQLDNVFLYNVDDLSRIVDANKALREEAARDAEIIIEYGVHRFRSWLRKIQSDPARLSVRELVSRSCRDIYGEGTPGYDERRVDALSERIAHEMLALIKVDDRGQVTAESVLAMMFDELL